MGNIGVSNNAFEGQDRITSAFFSSMCSFVGENAFKECVNLTEINKNNVIEKIGSSAFNGTNLSSVCFSFLTDMGESAFANCSKLTTISMPNCDNIPSYAFENCSNLSSITIEPTLGVTNKIGEWAFNNCVKLESVKIGDSRTSAEIKDGAFKGCVKLKDINFDNFTEIGRSAFYGCSNLSNISLSKCTKIEQQAFYNCKNLENVYLNNPDVFCSLTNKDAFKMNEDGNSTSVIKDSIRFYVPPMLYDTYVSDDIWKEYEEHIIMMVQDNQIIYVTSDNQIIEISEFDDEIIDNIYNGKCGVITFNDTVKVIYSKSFRELTTLKSVTLPSKCEEIGSYGFGDCTNLSSIKLPDNLKIIDDFAFENCSSLTSFTIPQTVKELGVGVFAGCTGIEKFDGKFASSDGKYVIYNETLICATPNNDIRVCDISDNIDGNITTLGQKCFYGCENLRRVDISENIKIIHDNAFEGCKNLREIHFHGEVEYIGENIFGVIKEGSDFKIFIPADKMDSYFGTNLLTYRNYIYPMPTKNSLIYYSDSDQIRNIGSSTTTVNTNPFTKKSYYYMKSNIKSVPEGHFTDNKNVSVVILGADITEIDSWAFNECENLQYVYLSDSISHFGEQCFHGCTSLESIHMPKVSSKTNFDAEIFLGCTNLKQFDIYYKESVSDDYRCFINNNELLFFAPGGLSNADYTIGENITKIGASAFSGVKNISKITLSEKTETIDVWAFADCSNLEKISNWENVTTISDCAFVRCANIGEIKMPKKLKTIGENAFSGCTNMNIGANDNIPDSITTIGMCAFEDCTNFMSGNSNELNLKSIKSVEYGTFLNCTSLKSVSIGDNVNTINVNAFKFCTSLESVNISENSKLRNIYDNAFAWCTSLKTLNLSNASLLKVIGISAFENCLSYETELVLNPSIISIGKMCFKGSGIKKLTINHNDISSTVVSIPAAAFSDCKKLQSIDISSNYITHIGGSAFKGCTELKEANIISPIETIGDYAFANCSQLCYINGAVVLEPINEKIIDTNINVEVIRNRNNLPSSVKTIGNQAFYECKLNNIVLPVALELLYNNCFTTSNSLALTVTVPVGLSTPPKFYSVSNTPFGEPGKITGKLYINIPRTYKSVYENDKYWGKYKSYMSAYSNLTDIPVELPFFPEK